MNSLRIAAVVVLYHPGPEVVANIRTWAGQVEAIFAVDNTEGDVSAAVSAIAALDKVVLVRNGENEGIARALNIGAEMALAEGCDFLLTMDQDSSAAPDMVEKMLFCLDGQDPAKVGIVSPFHVTRAEPAPKGSCHSCREVLTVMTSGNLLNLSVYKAVGPFMDELFIDFVDHEYCLRLREKGYKTIQSNRALLEHNVGDIHKYWIFIATNHSPLRRYYKTRNRFYVVDRYKSVAPRFYYENFVRFAKEVIVIAFFEHKKIEKFKMIVAGYCDYKKGVLGKFAGKS
nr:glycosyltransferase family 2 protein [Geomobilimonas luticola]